MKNYKVIYFRKKNLDIFKASDCITNKNKSNNTECNTEIECKSIKKSILWITFLLLVVSIEVLYYRFSQCDWNMFPNVLRPLLCKNTFKNTS